MIVVDTCIVFHLFNDSELHEEAEKLLEADPIWIIPPIWQDEYANVLAKLAIKERKIHSEVEDHYLEMLEKLKNNEISVEKPAVLKLAIVKKISFYDANFVMLAKSRGLWLITEDKEIIKKCPEYSLTINSFLNA